MSDTSPPNPDAHAALPQPHAAASAPLHVLGATREELRAMLESLNEPAYRADQILQWVYERGADAFEQMTNLPQRLRTRLAADADVLRGVVQAESKAGDDTRKLLLTWPDGESVESVWIPEHPRHTVCVSSQVGCPVGCRFCASGIDGVRRSLTAGEIVEQAWRVRRLVAHQAEPDEDGRPARLSNVVFMGMGEPLANYAAVVAAIRILNAPWGLNIGARKITVSTVGLPVQIRRLANEGLQINLALSLHAADDELRRELIPWGKVPIRELLDACDYFFTQTGREVTLEYVLLDGVNMSLEQARRLAAVCGRLRCNVNLLRYNTVAGLPYRRPSSEAAFEFQQALRHAGVNAHVRTSRGAEVDAACGQLRRRTAGGAAPGELPIANYQ